MVCQLKLFSYLGRKYQINLRYLDKIIKMNTLEKVRSELIQKLQSINSQEFLEALDKIITVNQKNDIVDLSNEQIAMLEMSEKDEKEGNLISQDAMNQRNLEWLQGM